LEKSLGEPSHVDGSRPDEIILVAGGKSPGKEQHAGGVITATSLLLDSCFSTHFKVHLIDTTAVAHPPESLALRVKKGLGRLGQFLAICATRRPLAALLWASGGFSLYEKLALCAVARLFGVRSLLLYVDSMYLEKVERSNLRGLHRFLFSIPNILVCRSMSWVDRFDVLGISRSKCAIVKNWIAPERYLGCRTPQPEGSAVVFLFVGWLIREKGTRELGEAIAVASQQLKDARWIVVGGGEEEDYLRRLLRSEGLEEKVELTGWRHPDQLYDYYRRANVLVLPSYGEGFPYAIIEAMCAGLPVITTPVGGIPGIFKDGEHGVFVPPRDANRLAEAMVHVANDHDFRNKVSTNVIEYVEANHDIQVVWKQLACLLEGRAS
jgi:glycosyltransferase involved in cell wall biosynthesis